MNTVKSKNATIDTSPQISSFSNPPDWKNICTPELVSKLAQDLFKESHTQRVEPNGRSMSENAPACTDDRNSLPGEMVSSGNDARYGASPHLVLSDLKSFIVQDAGTGETNLPNKTTEVKPAISDASVNSNYYFVSRPQNEATEKKERKPSKETRDDLGTRKDFPILGQKVNGKQLIWLDNAATSQKPQTVIDTLDEYYKEYNSNIHRGSHTLANKATTAYENAREKAQNLIGAASPEEIIFVRGATEAINLVAQTYGKMNIGAGDEILLTQMEHHSNIVPWQFLRKEKRAVIKVIPINDRGEIILGEYEKLLSPRTRIVALTHVSNVLGTINPLRLMIEMAHYHGAVVLIDGAQAVPHLTVNVRELDADFYAFSGHKVYGPTGIGVLYGKKELLEEMPPWQGGGSMIKEVTFEETTFNRLPFKFEAGTGNIADAIGLGAAIDYIRNVGMINIEQHTHRLTNYAMESLAQVPGLCLIGAALNKISAIAFIIGGISPEEIARHLDHEGIAVRTGHHCAQPTLQRYNVESTVRASVAMYNTLGEIDTLVDVLKKISKNRR